MSSENAFKELVDRILAPELEKTLNKLDEIMIAIDEGQWPSSQIEYAVIRHKDLKETVEDFTAALMDHYIDWKSEIFNISK